MWVAVGFFRGRRHLVPEGTPPWSWDYHLGRLGQDRLADLLADTDGYLFALCGAVCVRPPPGHRSWRRPTCTTCEALAREENQPGPGAPR